MQLDARERDEAIQLGLKVYRTSRIYFPWLWISSGDEALSIRY